LMSKDLSNLTVVTEPSASRIKIWSLDVGIPMGRL
jgi:hypothetical protein